MARWSVNGCRWWARSSRRSWSRSKLSIPRRKHGGAALPPRGRAAPGAAAPRAGARRRAGACPAARAAVPLRRRWTPRFAPTTSPRATGRSRAPTGRTSPCAASATPSDPDFALAYDQLWAEFGARGEMEARGGDRRATRLGPGASGRGAARSPTSCSCCGAPATWRRSATTPPWSRSARAAGPRRGPGRRAPLPRPRRAAVPGQRPRRLAARAAAPGRAALRRRSPGARRARRSSSSRRWSPRIPSAPGACARLRSYERAGFRKLDPATAPYAQPDFRPAGGPGRAPLPRRCPSAGAASRRARGRERRCRPPRWRAVVDAIYSVYGVHVPAVGARPASGRGSRAGPLASARFRPATSHRVITAYHHPGFAAPIGKHVMPMRKFQLVADGLARRATVRASRRRRRSAPRRLLPGAHARVRRRGAHRRAARPRRVAEVPVVARALAVGAAHERRRAAPRRRGALDDGVAAALASGFHHSHADHGEGFCTFNGLVVAAEALRAAGRLRTVAVLDLDLHYGNGTASLCAVAAVALQLLASTATTTGRTRRTATSRPCATRTAPTTSPSRCRTAAAARRCSRRSSAGRRRSSPTAGPTSCSTRPAPIPTARTRTRRSTSTTTTCASATGVVFAWAKREGLPARVGARRGLHARRRRKVVEVHLGTFDAACRRTAELSGARGLPAGHARSR